MSNFLVVYNHPYEKSFNHAVMETVMDNLKQHGHQTQLIDLYEDGFQPYFDKEELRLYNSGGTHDPLVERYIRYLKAADSIIFISPIWWNSIPGMLEGFLDKVMKKGEDQTWVPGAMGMVKGRLTNIKHTYILTTSTSPTPYLRFIVGNSVKGVFARSLKQLGMGKIRWRNFGRISSSKLEARQNYLAKLSSTRFE